MSADTRATVTGSRRLDTILFLSISALMVAAGPRLRVYYQATLVTVSVERINLDGTRTPLPTPPEFAHVGDGYWPGDSLIERLRPQIDSFMTHCEWTRDGGSEERFAWTIRWSDDSLALDHAGTIVWKGIDVRGNN